MNFKFALAAFCSVSDGEASIGEAANVARTEDCATTAGEAQGDRFVPLFVASFAPFIAPFNQDNETFACQASELQAPVSCTYLAAMRGRRYDVHPSDVCPNGRGALKDLRRRRRGCGQGGRFRSAYRAESRFRVGGFRTTCNPTAPNTRRFTSALSGRGRITVSGASEVAYLTDFFISTRSAVVIFTECLR
jgi:hypothetical protein